MDLKLRKKLQTIKNAFELVFDKDRKIVLALLISVFVYYLFIFANYLPNMLSVFEITGSYYLLFLSSITQATNFMFAAGFLNFFLVAVVSLLSGFTIYMITYKFRHVKTAKGKGGLTGALGIFSGALAASCPACSVALISFLGVSGGLAIFPLAGLEFSFMAIGLLVFSMYMISKSLVDCEDCKIKL